MATFSNDTKNTTSFTNDSFGAGQIISDSEGTFEDNEIAIERGIAYENSVKNTTTFTNETRN